MEISDENLYIDKREEKVKKTRQIIPMPEFNRSLFDNIRPQTLDIFYEMYPDTPVYLVLKQMENASPLFYKALICTYTGWWHGLQGWNIEDKHIESWELLEGKTVSDFIGKGMKLAFTPEEYENFKNKSTGEIIELIENI